MDILAAAASVWVHCPHRHISRREVAPGVMAASEAKHGREHKASRKLDMSSLFVFLCGWGGMPRSKRQRQLPPAVVDTTQDSPSFSDLTSAPRSPPSISDVLGAQPPPQLLPEPPRCGLNARIGGGARDRQSAAEEAQGRGGGQPRLPRTRGHAAERLMKTSRRCRCRCARACWVVCAGSSSPRRERRGTTRTRLRPPVSPRPRRGQTCPAGRRRLS